MLLPPYGLCVPARYRGCIDGRTVRLKVGTDEFIVRLPDVDDLGPHALAVAELALEDADRVSLSVPVPPDPSAILRAIDARPLPGYVFLSTRETLSQVLARHGHARRVAS